MFNKVDYQVASSSYAIAKILHKLNAFNTLSFDTETRGVYNAYDRKAAKDYLKTEGDSAEFSAIARQAVGNSGLSYPSIINVTHFVFGVSNCLSYILIPNSDMEARRIWRFAANYDGLLLVHNALFDLKIMYHRCKKLPKNYIDTALYAKCHINHVNIWKAKTGLKEMMGGYFDPAWALMNDYEPDHLRDPKFLDYAAIDGAATYMLWEVIQDFRESETEYRDNKEQP